MIRIISLAAAFALIGCGLGRDEGLVTSVERIVEPFTAVHNQSGLIVRVREAPVFRVSTVLSDDLQYLVATQVRNRELVIDAPVGSIANGGVVDVELPDFRGATVGADGEVEVSGVAGDEEVALTVLGSAPLSFSGTASRLEVASSGSGSISLRGSAALLLATLSGAGSLDASGMTATSADLSTSGPGDITAVLGGGSLRAQTSGTGNIDWWGDAEVLLNLSTGLGQVFHHPGPRP